MWRLSPATRVYVAEGYTDMRKSFNGLYGLVENNIRQNPISGHLFVFCNSRRNRLKIFFWDGSGFWVCGKRLERGRFSWPVSGDEKDGAINADMLSLLIGGMELQKITCKDWYRR